MQDAQQVAHAHALGVGDEKALVVVVRQVREVIDGVDGEIHRYDVQETGLVHHQRQPARRHLAQFVSRPKK
jgi:hypothetical protein